MAKRLLVVTVLLVTLLSTGSTATAYELLGGSWPWSGLLYCNSATDGDLDIRYGIAVNNWNSATGDIYMLSDCSDNDMGFLSSYATWSDEGGWSVLSPCDSCTYSAGWSYLNWYTLQSQTIQIRVAVAGHEIGHLLGLDHEDDVWAIMNSTPQATSPQSDDIAGIAAIY